MLINISDTSVKLLGKILLFFLLFSVCLEDKVVHAVEIKHIREDVLTRFTDFSSYLDGYSGVIVDIVEDDMGYIWLAGTKGLLRFDGNYVERYYHNWSSTSLPSSKVYCVEPDFYGRLWVGTEKGLCYYNYEQGDFVRFFTVDTNCVSADTFFIRKIFSDGDSLLWVDTQQGYLWKIDAKNLQVLHQYHHPPTAQPYYYYNPVYRDRDGDLWLGGRGKGPYRLLENEKRMEAFPISNYTNIPGKKRGNDAAYFYHDEEGFLWIGSTDGIYHYDKKRQWFHRFYATSSWAFLKDHSGQFWFSAEGGLGKFFPQTGELILFKPNEEDGKSLVGSYIFDLFEDSYHQIWIASAKGVSVFKPENSGVEYLFHLAGVPRTPASSFITSLVQDENGMVWLGTTSKGIDSYNPATRLIKHYTKENTKGLPAGNIRSLVIGPYGRIYVALWAGKGFGVLHPDQHAFSLYTYNKKNTNDDWYSDLAFHKDGRLFLGFWGAKGLTLFNPEKKSFVRNFKDKFVRAELSRLITCLEMDKNNHLWIGTTMTGLHLFYPERDTSVSFSVGEQSAVPVREKKIYAIAQDSTGNIWVGARGLYRININTLDVKKIEMGEREGDFEVYGLVAENDVFIWLMTSKGLYKYNVLDNSFINYSSAVKLRFHEDNACGIKLTDNRIMFGGINGAAIVDPQKIRLGQKIPHVFLSSVLVFDKEKIPNPENRKAIHLKYKENFFIIRVGSNVWGKNNPFRFYYKLEKFNNNWIEMATSEHEARFSNVPPGEYLFRVKVEDNQGNKYLDTASCMVYITPPYWHRWWFISLLALAFLSSVFYFWLTKLKSYRLSLFNSELNLKLLRLQMNPHFIFNSLFAIQNYIYSNQPHLAGSYLSDFAHLVRLILDNSRKETISIEDEVQSITLYLKLQKLRFEDEFDFYIEVDEELYSGDYQIPPMLAQPFLENAIEHGIKHSQRKGKIVVSYKLQEDKIYFTVEDNGIGLSASKRNKTKQQNKKESLAISICKKRLEILHKKKGTDIHFVVEEIKNEDGTVAGTKVLFSVPV